MRGTVYDEIMNIYTNKGLDYTLSKAFTILKETEVGCDERENKAVIKGELAEVTLTCQLMELQSLLKYQTYIVKGLFVKDTSSSFVTEIDLAFLTPYTIYLIECKSYSGVGKVITEEGKMYRGNSLISDVFSQSKTHLKVFNKNYGMFTAKGSKPYRIVVYNYSSKEFEDRRDDAMRKLLPVLSQDNFLRWIIKDLKGSKGKEDNVYLKSLYKKMYSDVNLFSKEYSEMHRKQLNY